MAPPKRGPDPTPPPMDWQMAPGPAPKGRRIRREHRPSMGTAAQRRGAPRALGFGPDQRRGGGARSLSGPPRPPPAIEGHDDPALLTVVEAVTRHEGWAEAETR
uniref:Uncharacterized protein n=1 Tax=Eutreptiella gymnastica TaxID=73025 RepID=A0A7S4CT34_9EUGL